MKRIKVVIAKILSTSIVGYIISLLYNNKIPFHRLKIDTNNKAITNSVKALIFWHFYESSEVRFIKKHIKQDLDIIELGGSLGVVSSIIGKYKGDNKKLITVEANPDLYTTIKKNLDLNHVKNAKVISSAISSSLGNSKWFVFGDDNTTGSVNHTTSSIGIEVPTITLNELVTKNNITKYALVCDIEGGEAELLVDSLRDLDKCELIIIELHHTTYKGKNYTPEELEKLIEKMGYKKIDKYGVNLVYKRVDKNE